MVPRHRARTSSKGQQFPKLSITHSQTRWFLLKQNQKLVLFLDKIIQQVTVDEGCRTPRAPQLHRKEREPCGAYAWSQQSTYITMDYIFVRDLHAHGAAAQRVVFHQEVWNIASRQSTLPTLRAQRWPRGDAYTAYMGLCHYPVQLPSVVVAALRFRHVIQRWLGLSQSTSSSTYLQRTSRKVAQAVEKVNEPASHASASQLASVHTIDLTFLVCLSFLCLCSP